jgi:hypothetical protein
MLACFIKKKINTPGKRKRKISGLLFKKQIFFSASECHQSPDVSRLKCPTVKNFTTLADPFLIRDGKGSKEKINFKIFLGN